MKVVIWGFPLHSHTHSYIHYGWYKAFTHLGHNTYWFDDNNFPIHFDFSNCLFITEGFADDRIPIVSSSIYFVHIARDPKKYIGRVKRFIEIRYLVDYIKDHVYDYTMNKENCVKISDCTYYEKLKDNGGLTEHHVSPEPMEYECIYTCWATDLLPHEILEENIYKEREKKIYWFGSAVPWFCKELEIFQEECIRSGIEFVTNDPWINPKSFEDVKECTIKSFLAPDIRSSGDPNKIAIGHNGTCHKQNGYIPCRLLKSISYGQLGVTNSKHTYELLEKKVIYNDNERHLFYDAVLQKNNHELIREQMKIVREKHTYLNRIQDLLTVLKPRVLHISHHVGCMRDHAYLYERLGCNYTFWKFDQGYHISAELAKRVWNEKKNYFNTFDIIVTSDTAPLARIFMEHQEEVKPKVLVWICNRFDYAMEADASFYDLFRNASKDTFKLIPYSSFEKQWCSLKGVETLDVITPIGITPVELEDKIDGLQKLKDSYIHDSNAKETDMVLKDKIFIPIYGNDNHYFPLKQMLESSGIACYNGGFHHPYDLKQCKGLVTFPDQFSKFNTFETIQNEILVFLPSEFYLIQLHPTHQNGHNYWFNSPLGYLNKELIEHCYWYKYKECRIYFDSIDDLVQKIKGLTPEIIEEKRNWCRIYGQQIEKESMDQWKIIINS